MSPSRRRFLGLAGGAGLLALNGCGVPSPLPAFPGTRPAPPKIRVAGLYGGHAFGSANDRLSVLLQQAVDHLVDGGDKAIDPRSDWLAVTPATPPSGGQPYVPGEVATLEAALGGAGGSAPGAAPDLVAFGSAYTFPQVVAQKLLRPLDDLLNSTSTVTASDYFPGALDACRVGGKLYGLPLAIMPSMLSYDSALFQEAGLAAPDGSWDWNRFLDACVKLTKPPGQYAFMPFNPLSILPFLWQNGAAVLSKDGRHSTLTDTAAVDAAAFYASLYRQYKIVAPQAPGANGYSYNGSQITYNGARIAMQINATPNLPGMGGKRTWRLAELFRGASQATELQLQSVLAMTSRTADPAATFVELAAVAEQVQKKLYLPPRRSLAKTSDPLQAGFALEPDEQAAIIRVAEYARAATFSQQVNSLVFSKLQAPLQEGDQSPAAICQAAAAVIDAALAT